MESLVEENARLQREVAELRSTVERLERRVQELLHALEEAQRAARRQAAPFSRHRPKGSPAKPGRKAGAGYGCRSRRPIPPAFDQTLESELPDCCPHCGGELEETKIDKQYQTEIPQPKIEGIEFHIHVGRCKRCGERVQGRHPRQSSDAVGCAASQLGLRVSRGGLAQALERVARKAEPTYQELVGQIRGSPSVTPDETGWKVGGKLWWMWAFSSDRLTVYSIQPGRGYEQAAAILGANFDGFLVRDGWAVYRRFTQAVHQTCLAHLLRRCREMLEVATPGEAKFPLAMKEILQDSLKLRDRRDLNQIGEHELAIACQQLEDRLDSALERNYRSAANRRLSNHLVRERDAIFPFLYCPGLDATNYRAEQAIRPMVVTRKVWGGNRTENGAHSQSILVSILQTCRQQLRPATEFLEQLLRLPKPKALEIIKNTPR